MGAPPGRASLKSLAFGPDKTRALCLLNNDDNNDVFVNVGNKHMKKTLHIIMQGNQISHMFRNFPVYKRH